MTDIIKSLNWRYATKKMNGKRIPEDCLNTVLEAIRLAPSSMGLQPYQVLIVEKDELKQELLPIANNQSQITGCSHLLIFTVWNPITNEKIESYIDLLAQKRQVTKASLEGYHSKIKTLVASRSEEQNLNWAAKQAYIAMGTGIVAAASLGIDATPMEGFNSSALDEKLNLKTMGLKSVTLLPLGYRDEENDWLLKLPKVRRPIEELFTKVEGF
jgi:nitroreductase / dihydropteridine reductase